MGGERVPLAEHAAPFAELTPDAILAAVESLGLHCDGRVLALNSYENRVYRIGVESEPPRVAKFYRPSRWSDAAILEEHAFSAELCAADISVVAPERIAGGTLHHHGGMRFALFATRLLSRSPLANETVEPPRRQPASMISPVPS